MAKPATSDATLVPQTDPDAGADAGAPESPPEPERERALPLGEPVTVTLPGPDGRFRAIMPGAGYALQVESAAPVFLPAEDRQVPQQIRPREDLRIKGVAQVIVGEPGQAVRLLAKRRGE